MKKNILLIPAVLLLHVACNNPEEKKTGTHENHLKQDRNEQQKKMEGYDNQTVKILLDNGKKWKANTETVAGINEMSSLVMGGITGKLNAVEIYDTLQFTFKSIFDKCTMTGESHNQLHNYLIPLKDDLTKLKTSKTNIATLKEMHKYLLTFKKYFE